MAAAATAAGGAAIAFTPHPVAGELFAPFLWIESADVGRSLPIQFELLFTTHDVMPCCSASFVNETGYVKAKAGTFLYKKFAWPLISRMDGEDAHALSIWATRNRLTPGAAPLTRCMESLSISMYRRSVGCDQSTGSPTRRNLL